MFRSMATAFAGLTVLAGSMVFAESETDTLVIKGSEGPGHGKHIVLIAGDEEYRSEESMPMLAKILSKHHGFDCTVIFSWTDDYIDPNNQIGLRGLSALKTADLMIIGTRFRRPDAEQAAHITNFLNAGKPVIGFRTATHAFTGPGSFGEGDSAISYDEFGRRILGEQWVNHHGGHKSQGTRGVIEPANAKHPVLRGVADVFGPTDVYGVTHLTDEDTILLRAAVTESLEPDSAFLDGPKNNPMHPLAWLHGYTSPNGSATGSSFCTTAGASVDFVSEDLRRIIVNAAYYLCGLEVPQRANVEYVDPFYPSFYGFISDPEWFSNEALILKDVAPGQSPTMADPPGSPDWPHRPRPEGFSHRPDPNLPPWLRMDYGPFISTAINVGGDGVPVNKGIVVQLRTSDGSPTSLHAVFDTDLLSWRLAWDGEIALQGIVYDGPHGIYPSTRGTTFVRAPALPGAGPSASDLKRDPRDEPWGPVPRKLGRWSGLHLDGNTLVFDYTIASHRVLERVWADAGAFVREITVEATHGTNGEITFATPSVIDGARFRLVGNVKQSADASYFTVPVNETCYVIMMPSDTELDEFDARPDVDVHTAISTAGSRWGDPLITRGVIDESPEESRRENRRIDRPAGSPQASVELVSGGLIEIVHDDVVTMMAPALEAIVVQAPAAHGQLEIDDDDQIGLWAADTGHGEFERNALTGSNDLRLDGVTWRRGIRGRSLDFDGTAAAWLDEAGIDFGTQDLTIAVWIHTNSDGTIFANSNAQGPWSEDGATLFLRGGQLSFDVGWVGVVTGGPRIDDGTWHHVAATWRHEHGEVELFVDGESVAEGDLALNDEKDRDEFVARFGWTNDNFPEVTRFSGYMDGLYLIERSVTEDDVMLIAGMTGEPLVQASVVRQLSGEAGSIAVVKIIASDDDDEMMAQLILPSASHATAYDVTTRKGPRSIVLEWAREVPRYPGESDRPFRIDRLTRPDENPYGSWLRFGAFDFLPDANGDLTSGVVTTWSGDVWRIDGLDEDIEELQWTRMATGLNQPFGVAVNDKQEILVLGREQITRLRDINGDGEADFYENFSNAIKNSEHFHEPASGLLIAPDGSLFFHKAARHAKYALHDHHGSVIRVSPDGSSTLVVARGFRAPIGLAMLPDGSLLGSDQEGHWTPANRINLIRPAAGNETPLFYGNGWAARNNPGLRIEMGGEVVQRPWDAEIKMELPLCWIHSTVDRSPSSHVYVEHPSWGPLQGAVLGLSYGTGEVYLVLREDVLGDDGTLIAQGGVVKLGIQMPTGLIMGRMHPETGDLYVCGLFGWSSNQTEPGGLFRVRPKTDSWVRTLNVPRECHARSDGIELTFLHPLNEASVSDIANWDVTAWNYRRTADYGSTTYALSGEAKAKTTWQITRAELSADGCTVRLHVKDFEPAMQVDLAWKIHDARGRSLEHSAHLSIHATASQALANNGS